MTLIKNLFTKITKCYYTATQRFLYVRTEFFKQIKTLSISVTSYSKINKINMYNTTMFC